MLKEKLSILLLILVTSCAQTSAPEKERLEAEDTCLCMEIYEPVCGKDGQTYANACEATCKKISFTPGECR
jgi:hypothetical protein